MTIVRAVASRERNTLPGTGRCSGGGGCSSVDTLSRTGWWPCGLQPAASVKYLEKSRVSF